MGLIFRLLIFYWPNKELVDLDPSNLWLLYAIENEEEDDNNNNQREKITE